jgi:aspartate/methionine/tyrosine aminotransferase
VQLAGLTAIRDGEPLVSETVARLRSARDVLVERLNRIPGLEVAPPPGAMYLFLRLATNDSLGFAKELVARAGLGLAPGVAFGPEGEGFLRWCFAASEDLLVRGADRLANHLRGLAQAGRSEPHF